jgi:hypothetical protein
MSFLTYLCAQVYPTRHSHSFPIDQFLNLNALENGQILAIFHFHEIYIHLLDPTRNRSENATLGGIEPAPQSRGRRL